MHVSQLLCGQAPSAAAPIDARATPTAPAPATITKRPRKVPLKNKPYRKFYTNAAPSSHCHICARTSKAVRFVNCSKLKVGLCRKVICDKCFDKFQWDFEAALNDPKWTCPHCRNACPPGKSQCFIYQRVNRKRESKRKANNTTSAKKFGNNNTKKTVDNNNNMSPLAMLAKATATVTPAINHALPRNFSSASTASNSSYSPPPSVYADPPSPYAGGGAVPVSISPMSVTNVAPYGGHQSQYQYQAPYQQRYQLPVTGTPAFRYGLNPQVLFNIPVDNKNKAKEDIEKKSRKGMNEGCAIPIEKLLAPEPCALSASTRQSTVWSPSLQLDKTYGIEVREISKGNENGNAIPKSNTSYAASNITTTCSPINRPLPRLPPAPSTTLRWN